MDLLESDSIINKKDSSTEGNSSVEDFSYQNIQNDTDIIEPTEQQVYDYEKNTILKRRKLSVWFLFITAYGVYFTLMIFVSNIVLLPIGIKGASMYPTLNYTSTEKNDSTYGDVAYLLETQNVEKKDIIVIDALHVNGDNENSYYIKRVIGTSGDKLQFKRTSEIKKISDYLYLASYSVYLNGNILVENYVNGTMSMYVGSPNVTDLTGVSNMYKKVINEEEILIPENCVFVMGDNRNASTDSRDFGFVETKYILGKVKIHTPYGKSFLYSIFHSIKEKYIF